jgi:hypothetical protein
MDIQQAEFGYGGKAEGKQLVFLNKANCFVAFRILFLALTLYLVFDSQVQAN